MLDNLPKLPKTPQNLNIKKLNFTFFEKYNLKIFWVLDIYKCPFLIFKNLYIIFENFMCKNESVSIKVIKHLEMLKILPNHKFFSRIFKFLRFFYKYKILIKYL